jgi:hypothetical protein
VLGEMTTRTMFEQRIGGVMEGRDRSEWTDFWIDH